MQTRTTRATAIRSRQTEDVSQLLQDLHKAKNNPSKSAQIMENLSSLIGTSKNLTEASNITKIVKGVSERITFYKGDKELLTRVKEAKLNLI
jgi:hypothetical protein